MSCGGTVIQVIINKHSVLVEIEDKNDRQWRALDKNEKTVCIGIGDALWWQQYKGYWTPFALRGQNKGDIYVGTCKSSKAPEKIIS